MPKNWMLGWGLNSRRFNGDFHGSNWPTDMKILISRSYDCRNHRGSMQVFFFSNCFQYCNDSFELLFFYIHDIRIYTMSRPRRRSAVQADLLHFVFFFDKNYIFVWSIFLYINNKLVSFLSRFDPVITSFSAKNTINI